MKPVYVCAAGSDADLGSSIARRGYLDCLRERGRLVVWTGSSSADYVSGLRLSAEDIRTRHFHRWYVSAAVAAVRGRASIAFDAGDPAVHPPVSTRRVLHMWSLALLILLTRIRGTRGIGYGRAVERVHAHPVHRASNSLLTGLSSAIVDAATDRTEWTLRTGRDPAAWSHDRPLIALVLRGDRPAPTAEWIAWVRGTAARLGMEPAVLVHCADDYLTAQDLSRTFGGAYRAWFVADHAEHEASMREVYARSAIVISDRVEALLIGATEGAVPLGWVESSTGAVGDRFDVLSMTWAGRWEGDAAERLPLLDHPELDELRRQLRHEMVDIRSHLGRTSKDVVDHVDH